MREGLSLLVDHQPEFKVVGLASTIKDALSIAGREQPDVALLDIKLGNDDGIDCLPEMQRVSPKTRVLVLTGLSDIETHYAAVSQGAMGIVRKIEGPETLVNAIRKVLSGEVWVNGELMAKVLNDLRQARATPLTGTSGDQVVGSVPAHAVGWRLPVSKRDEYEEVKIARLTDREREVIGLVGQGMRNQQIADKLCISVI
ncbi:MAG TPA: response regulator transcription factor, partial [Blastocatellia bacterium]|nr:response regulator transcription factor [Blastocatellia bacterium]